MLRTDATAALNKRCDHLLGRWIAIGAVLGLPADNSFVGFDNLIRAAERTAVLVRLKICHSLADTVRHEPCRSIRAKTEHAEKLMRRHTFLSGAHEMRRQKPLMHRNMRTLVNGPNCRGKLFDA